MLVTESSALNRLYNLNIKRKMLIIFSSLSLIWLSFSLLSLIWLGPFILYGTLYGLVALYLSYALLEFSSFLLKNKKPGRIYGLTIYFLRIGIFLLFFSIAIFLINPFFVNTKGVKLLLKPLNIVSFFITYFLYVISVYFLPIYDYVIKRLIDKQIIKKSKEKKW